MKTLICQSCGWPFPKATVGTNRDKSENSDYCRDCYQDGAFTDKSLNLHQLEVKLLEMAEMHEDISLEEARQLIKKLPELKRWRMEHI
ncbi:zinc ribbon domain-containing protein [Salegentibacter sp. BDJ18]|jgi:NAD-dependent SIR2 family protein deacetylase|uniref:zinc ribbon domain-containing protein n=1 Tax=Salegentibacter sp. BDJ18 TaxID=2816376 RepID=UPI001AAF208D|nr:zinc ribbon domain-containing protein [Salegentibacter sp. BDJ18]MBO2544849.1 zinc ribbon domain-containing protein [Salegentibacter sp. BDJ18]